MDTRHWHAAEAMALQQLRGSPSGLNWRQVEGSVASIIGDDAGFEPRSTSAPPHLEDRFAAHLLAQGRQPEDGRFTPLDGYMGGDIRCDEDYERFYRMQAGAGAKLPPPLDNRTLYDLQRAALVQGGLDAGGQRGPSPVANGVDPSMLQALSLAIQQRGQSPAQQLHDLRQPMLQQQEQAELLQRLASFSNDPAALSQHSRSLNGTPTLPHQQSPSPLLGHHPGSHSDLLQQQHDSDVTALAAAMQAAQQQQQQPQQQHQGLDRGGFGGHLPGQRGLSYTPPFSAAGQGVPGAYDHHAPQGALPGTPAVPAHMHNSVEYRAAFDAAYNAALQQQAASMQPSMMLGAGGLGPSGLGPSAGARAPYLMGYPGQPGRMMHAAVNAAQMAVRQQGYGSAAQLGNPHAATAAAAAAAAATAVMNGGPRRGPGFADARQGRAAPGPRGGRRERHDRNFRLGDYEEDNDFHSRFQTIDEVVGQVLATAKDQNGCRFLQRKFEEGGAAAIATVFPEVLEHMIELMVDPFGNYLVQKLLDRCSEEQRLQVLQRAAEQDRLVSAALNTHGTRAVQKLIETLATREQKQLVVQTLRGGVVALIRDLNGNHVIQRCLQRLGPEDSQFVYDAACAHTMDIATHRHGCCVLQRCIDFATPLQKRALVVEIAANALAMSQDPFGNYVVQYVLELGHVEATATIMRQLYDHYADLAQQKFSSNVVEKCLKLGGPGLAEHRERVIRELIASPQLPRLLQDPYANYVLQSALTVSSSVLHQQLVEAIKPYLPSLRGTPHGKRILAKIQVKV